MNETKKKIVATLKYGKVLSRSLLAFLFVSIFLSCTMIIALFIVAFYCNNYKIIVFDLFPALFIFVLIVLIIDGNKARQDIRKWVLDAVPIEAYCEEVLEPQKKLKIGCVGKISVSFSYNGNKITLYSQKSADAKFDPTGSYGSDKVFRKFVNKKVNILYSPSYKEVMFVE